MQEKSPNLLEIERELDVTFNSEHSIGETPALRASFERVRLYEMVDLLEARAVFWHGRGQTVFAGLKGRDSEHGLFAAPALDPLVLMEDFEVGSHNDPSRQRPAQACAGMRRIHDAAPFVPYFADKAGFKVRFVAPVPIALARKFEAIVLGFDLDALSLLPEDDEPSLARSIHENGRLELWWD
jgi:hypothetical protein